MLDAVANNFLNDCLESLESPSDRFTMGSWYNWKPSGDNWCGTPACVLGHYLVNKEGMDLSNKTGAEAYLLKERPTAIYNGLHPEITGNLTLEQRRSLFASYGCDEAGTNVHKAKAFIRNFILDNGGSLRKPPEDVAVPEVLVIQPAASHILEEVPV